MDAQVTIGKVDLTGFLASGAILRDAEVVHLFQGPFSVAETPKKQAVSVCCPFFYETEKLSFLTPKAVFTLSAANFARTLMHFLEESTDLKTSPEWKEPSKSDFEAAFIRIQNLISQGQIEKAVPAVFARADFAVTAQVRAAWLVELLKAPNSLNPFGFWDGDQGLMGATPEILFKAQGRRLSTMALAGTLAKSDGTCQDLARSSKDQSEHAMVVEDLRQKLSEFGRVGVGGTNILELPTLWHLKTNIELELSESLDITAVLQRLHPTAALGVFPRSFGWRWLKELPGQEERRYFGAPITFILLEDRAISLVAIRMIQWQGGHLVLGSGCGVVKQSVLESEWRELDRKRSAVRSVFGMKS